MGPQRTGLDLATEQQPSYAGELGEETRGKSKKSFMKMGITGLKVETNSQFRAGGGGGDMT